MFGSATKSSFYFYPVLVYLVTVSICRNADGLHLSNDESPLNFSIKMSNNRIVIENLASILPIHNTVDGAFSLTYSPTIVYTGKDGSTVVDNDVGKKTETNDTRKPAQPQFRQNPQQTYSAEPSLPVRIMQSIADIKKINKERYSASRVTTAKPQLPTVFAVDTTTGVLKKTNGQTFNDTDPYIGKSERQFPWTVRDFTQTFALTSVVGQPVVYTDVVSVTDTDDSEQLQAEIIQIFTETLYRMQVLFPKVYDTPDFLTSSRTMDNSHSLSVHVFNNTEHYERATKSNDTCGRFMRSYNRGRYSYDIFVNYWKSECSPHKTFQHEYVHFLESVPAPYEVRYDPVWWTEGLALTLTSTCKFNLASYVKNYTLYEMVASNDLDPYPIGQILHEFFSSREPLRKSYETLAAAFVHGNGKLFYQTAFDSVLKHQDSFVLKKCV